MLKLHTADAIPDMHTCGMSVQDWNNIAGRWKGGIPVCSVSLLYVFDDSVEIGNFFRQKTAEFEEKLILWRCVMVLCSAVMTAGSTSV
jgi:hypothetical protein